MVYTEQNRSIGSDAFSLEYLQNTPAASIRTDLESFFGEYCLFVPRYKWGLLYAPDEFGMSHLVSPHDHEPMTVKCQRAIQKRKNAWKNTSREEAEYASILSLETQLSTAVLGDMVFWTSPPGHREDGYGSYGYFFVGEITAEENSSKNKRISMKAIRIENQSVTQCSEALTALIGETVHYNTAEDCIRNPKIMPPVDENIMQYVLTDIFHFTLDEKREELFAEVMHTIKPQVDNFVHLIQRGASKREIQRGFWALDNYTVSLRTMTEQYFDGSFEMLVTRFGQHARSAVAGSCGSTSVRSSNIFNNSLSSVISLFSPELSENFVCPSCGEESTLPVGDQCPKCHITKDEAQQKGLITC